MTDWEKLVELLNHEFGKIVSEITADWLIAHGVTVRQMQKPLKVEEITLEWRGVPKEEKA